jgi:hypothetical protein
MSIRAVQLIAHHTLRSTRGSPILSYLGWAGPRRARLNNTMTATEYTSHLENEIDRLVRERIALLREIVQVLSTVVDAIPSAD